MSYTPPTRPPPMIPPPSIGSIPPPMMPPYGYPPMIPPPMMSVRPPMIPPVLPPNMDPKKQMGEKAPSTTVFVGNISERAPDVMMRHMLQRCGNVLNWKRVQGTNGKLQAFGFCEYDNPDATLRCIRLLNGYEIAEKKILVKVDQKTRELLSEHIKKTKLNDKSQMTKNAKKAVQLRNKKSTNDLEEEKSDLNLEVVDEDTLKEDRIVISSFEVILKQYAKDLAPPEPTPPPVETPAELPSQKPAELPSQNSLSTAPAETDKKEDDKDKEKERDRDKDREKDKERERDRDKDRDRDRERDRDRSSRLTTDRERDRMRSPLNERHKPAYHSSSSSHHYEGERDLSRSPSESRTRSKRRASPSFEEMPRSGSQTRNGRGNDDSYSQKENRREAILEETEEMKERKRLERKLREKEMAYRERLKAWESREQKKKHEYSIEKKKDIQRHKLILKEAKKLKQFLEDYEDLKDDPVYYKGPSLEKKLKLREKEIEMDNKDRQKEREELEELKRKLIEKGNADPDAEAKRIQNDENIRMKKKFEKYDESSSSSSEDEASPEHQQLSDSETHAAKLVNTQLSDLNPNRKETDKENENESVNENQVDSSINKDSENMIVDESNEDMKKDNGHLNSQSSIDKSTDNFLIDDNSMSQLTDSPMKLENSPGASNSPIFSGSQKSIQNNVNNVLTHSVTIKSVGSKKTIQPKNQIFADEEEDQSAANKKAKLLSSMNSDERKKTVKKLVESIPTDRDQLFAYPIDWEQLDQSLMEKRIKPWINKKIIEYIGEEEESLNDFICSKIKQQTKPDRLLEEVKVVLDDEAELFVKKMWRLIVYETESKRCGLSK